MSNLRNRLIRLGNTNPELRTHLRPILSSLDKTAGGYEFGGSLFNHPSQAAKAALEWYYAEYPEILELSDREIAKDLKSEREGRELNVNNSSGRTPAFSVVDYLEGRV